VRSSQRLRSFAVALGCIGLGVLIGSSLPRNAAEPRSEAADLSSREPDSGVSGNVRVRDMFSPNIRDDSYVRSEQLRVVEMVEGQCRTTKENCRLAADARKALEAK
jgi:hypothetical protein